MPKGPKGEKRAAAVTDGADMVGRIATGEVERFRSSDNVIRQFCRCFRALARFTRLVLAWLLDRLCGLGGVFNIRRKTASRFSSSDLAMTHKIPTQALFDLYATVGELVISWGFVESSLEAWVAIVYQAAGGKHHIETTTPGIPRVWSRKRSFLRRCFLRIQILDPFAKEGAALLDRVAVAETVRHQVIHGALADYDADKKAYKFVALVIDQTQDIHVETPAWVSLQQIMDAAGGCLPLGSDMSDFAMRLIEAIVPKDQRANLTRRIVI